MNPRTREQRDEPACGARRGAPTRSRAAAPSETGGRVGRLRPGDGWGRHTGRGTAARPTGGSVGGGLRCGPAGLVLGTLVGHPPPAAAFSRNRARSTTTRVMPSGGDEARGRRTPRHGTSAVGSRSSRGSPRRAPRRRPRSARDGRAGPGTRRSSCRPRARLATARTVASSARATTRGVPSTSTSPLRKRHRGVGGR